MKNLSGINYYFVIFFILFTSPLVINSYKSILHNETEKFIIDQVFAFDDNTLVMNLLKPINETCAEPQFNFRIVYSNGTFDTVNFYPPIPEHNFCHGTDGNYLFFIQKASLPMYLNVLYVNSTDVNSAASYYVLLINQTGDAISNSYISPVTFINGSIYNDVKIKPHSNEAYGFFFTRFHETEPLIIWSYFSAPDDEGKYNLLNSGKVYLQNPLDKYRTFYTIDGSFGILTLTSLNVTKMTSAPAFKAFITFIKPTTNVIMNPVLIFSSSIPNLTTEYDISILCNGLTYSRTFNYCTFAFKSIYTHNQISIIEIIFTESGTVTNERRFDINIDKIRNYGFINLPTGGYSLYACTGQIINSTILDNNLNYNSTLDFPSNVKASKCCQLLFGSEIIFLVTQDDEIFWQVFFANLPKFNIDNEYGNSNIEFTYPLINSTISLSITNINITYKIPVKISANNISIYQDGNPPILRQTVPGKLPFFSYSSDNKTINIKVLNSTFNQPNSNYYVVVDDYTVRQVFPNRPLLGIKKNHWSFNTINNKYLFADDMTGRFALTANGANYYNNLSSYDQKSFLLLLKFHLSKTIPININRLNNIECCKHNGNQIILSLHITSTTNLLNEKNVESIIKDLNILIQQKHITAISWYNTTNYLDQNFGFKIDETLNFNDTTNKYKFHITGAVIGIIILFSIYFYARQRYYEGKNIVILLLVLSIFDLVSDILFIVNHATDVSELVIPSIIFCVLPITINFVICIIIISQEFMHNRLFRNWFKRNINIGILFTILASLDLKALDMLSSQFAGLMIFNANLSEGAQLCIFWGTIISLIVEDIPQFIIQILYKKSIYIYNAVPFVTLGISSIVLAVNIGLKLYQLRAYFNVLRLYILRVYFNR